jgi:inhibitor of the pro-sigma K processing machinery
MENVGLWAAAAGLALTVLLLARRPLAAAGRLLFRSGVGLCCLWVFDQLGSLVGIRVGVNLVSGLVLGVLGAPGLGLLLLTQWALG